MIDTNIVIFFFKEKYALRQKIKDAGEENCFISEITLAELRYGAENSSNVEKHKKQVDEFIQAISVLPISSAIETFAKEKSRLRKSGQLIDNFDLLIGATAIINQMTLVTNNIRHFERLENLLVEDWTKDEISDDDEF